MNKKISELIEDREKLLSRIDAQREQMTEIGSQLRTPLLLADKGMAVARYLRFHTVLLAGIAVFMVIQRRSVAGLALGVWRMWKAYRDFISVSAKRLL